MTLSEQEAPITEQRAAPEAPAATGRPEARRPYQGGPRRSRGFGGKDFRPRKVCKFCVERGAVIDYKDVNTLRGFVSDKGKIWPTRVTGVCAGHQRELSNAIKRARILAWLPFATSS